MTNPKNKVIGIVGGGQLGRMTILEARKMDIKVIVLTPEHPSPASDIADEYIIGSLYDEKKIKELAEKCDILSYEIEHINVSVLEAIKPDISAKKLDPFAALHLLSEVSGTVVPKPLAELEQKPILHNEQIEKNKMKDTVLKILKL